jgi:hypothetical protein
MRDKQKNRPPRSGYRGGRRGVWWRGGDSNPRPLGYEPNELPLLHPAARRSSVSGRRPAGRRRAGPRRPRLPGGRPPSTLRRCGGSRPGSGWDRVGPPRSRPRARPAPARRPPSGHVCVYVTPAAGDAPPPPAPCRARLVWSVHGCMVGRGRLGSIRSAASVAVAIAVSVAGQRTPGSSVGPRRVGPLRFSPLARPAPCPRPAAGTGLGGATQQRRPRPLGRVGSGRSPAVHPPPINPVVSRGPYLVSQWGDSSWDGIPA